MAADTRLRGDEAASDRNGVIPAWPLRVDERLAIGLYEARFAPAFAELNLEWLEHWFEVEPIDREVLTDPERHVIRAGGEILFALLDGNAVGTVALKRDREGHFELTKMAVAGDFRGRGIGRHLLDAAIRRARERAAHRVYLYSNTVLEPAIALYRRFGFTEVPLGAGDDRYARSNIKMVLTFPAS
jgi:ribosomal protein S18 acetylase RimI-like enzyme